MATGIPLDAVPVGPDSQRELRPVVEPQGYDFWSQVRHACGEHSPRPDLDELRALLVEDVPRGWLHELRARELWGQALTADNDIAAQEGY